MPKQLVCQNREETNANASSVEKVSCSSMTNLQQRPTTSTVSNGQPAKQHRLGSFSFQPYQLFNPTPYAKKKIGDDVTSNASAKSTESSLSSKSFNSKEQQKQNDNRMIICDDGLPISKVTSPTTIHTAQKTSCQPSIVSPQIGVSPQNTTHLVSSNTTTEIIGQPTVKLPPTSMTPNPLYPYNQSTKAPTLLQPLPPLPPLPSRPSSLIGLTSPNKINQKQGLSKNTKKGLSSPKPTAHLTTNNFSTVVNSGSTKSFGPAISTTQNFFASPIKSDQAGFNNPYNVSTLTTTFTTSTQNENINILNHVNSNQQQPNCQPMEKKEAPPANKPIPKLPFGTLSLMN